MNDPDFHKEEKVIPEHDKMGLVQALIILHYFQDALRSVESESELADSLDVIFEWIDNAVLLFHKLAHSASSSDVPLKGTET